MDNAHFNYACAFKYLSIQRNKFIVHDMDCRRTGHSKWLLTLVSLYNVFDGLNIYYRDLHADTLESRLKVKPQMLNMTDKYDGYTTLHYYAAQNDPADIVRLMLEMYADPIFRRLCVDWMKIKPVFAKLLFEELTAWKNDGGRVPKKYLSRNLKGSETYFSS